METSCDSLIAPGLVDTPLKLQLVLLFYRHRHLCGEASQLNHWLHESPWDVEEALAALATAALVDHVERQGRTVYYLRLNAAHWPWLDALAACYDDPLRRDDVYARVREANREREFRAWARAVDQSPSYLVC